MVEHTDSAVINSTRFRRRKSVKRWACKNVYGVSVSMVMVFTAFIGLQNLQSSINSDGGLGLISLSVLYGVFVAVGLFTPSILRILGTKYSLLIGYLCHLLYTLSNYYPSWYTLIPGSILIGLASGPIWTAAGSHLAQVAIEVKRALSKEQNYLISKYTAIFYFIFQFSQIPGNLSSSLIFFPYSNSTTMYRANSSFFVTFSEEISSPLNSTDVCDLLESTTIDKTYLYVLVSIYTLFIMIGIAVLLLSVDKLPVKSTMTQTKLNVYLKQPLLEMFYVFRNIRMILLAPMALYAGMEMAFTFGTFTSEYISQCLGTYQVGFALMILGSASGFMSFVCSRVVKYLPRFIIVLIGAAVHFSLFIILALWEREPSYLVVYGGAFMWGCGNAVWNTVGTSLAGILFPKKLNSAFSILRMWLALGFMLSFVTANLISVQTRLWILIGLLCLTVICMLIVEFAFQPKEELIPCYDQLCQKQSTSTESLNSETSSEVFDEASTPFYISSTLFEACGSVVLSDMTTSFLYRCNGDIGSSSSNSSNSSSIFSYYNPQNATASSVRNARIRANQSAVYSCKSEIFERNDSKHSPSIAAHNSAPLFSQYAGKTLSNLSISFVNSVIQANKVLSDKSTSSSVCAVKGNSSDNSVFEMYTGEGLTNLSSSFLHTSERDGTLSNVSSTSAFEEYESRGVILLTTSFLTRHESRPNSSDQEQAQSSSSDEQRLNFTCDSIDGTQPLTQPTTYSFSHYLHSMRPPLRPIAEQGDGYSGNITQLDHINLTHPSTRAISAPASSNRADRRASYQTPIQSGKSSNRNLEAITQRPSHSKECKRTQGLVSKLSDVNVSVSNTTNKDKSDGSESSLATVSHDRDSRSDVIYIGPSNVNSDTDEESVWTAVSLSRYSV